jgi:heptosyltransferase I
MTLNFKPPLQHVCLLRISAIGDTCHALAALRAFQAAWPRTRFTWIIGKLEAKLMTAILPEIEFITFDKSATLKELWRLRRALRGRRFDLLLDLQLSIRASLISSLVSAPIKLGFDRQRARAAVVVHQCAHCPGHQGTCAGFVHGIRARLRIEPGPPRWTSSCRPRRLEYARGIVTDGRPTLLISPCSSHTARNWFAERYAAVAAYAAAAHRMRVVLVGGRSATERRWRRHRVPRRGPQSDRQGHAAAASRLMSQSTALLSPDSGPAHMATMVGLPVIGLYAATNPARAGPYYSRTWCIDVRRSCAKVPGKPAAANSLTTKIEPNGVMDLIGVSEVTAKL